MQPITEESTRFELFGLDTEEYYQKRFGVENGLLDVSDTQLSWAQNYARDFYHSCRKHFFMFFDSFAGDDLRLRQSLVATTLTNPSLIKKYKEIKDPGADTDAFLEIGEYLTSALCLRGHATGTSAS